MPSVDEIEALLPQTQCTRCGFNGCRPYAGAVEAGLAEINQCPPGGSATIAALATLLGREALPLNPANGIEAPPMLALIDEDRCIGCAKCLAPCPVDAIVGARRQMHTVIASICTGCELCIAPCPVDCIVMVERTTDEAPSPAANRLRYAAHTARLSHRSQTQAELLAARKRTAAPRAPSERQPS